MAQFSVYRNPRRSAQHAPYLLDVQTDFIPSSLRVVIPLVEPGYFGPAARGLNPIFSVAGQKWVLSPNEIGSLPAKVLGPAVGNLAYERDQITNALDLLFHGF